MIKSYESDQQVFDLVVDHLSKMKTQSTVVNKATSKEICQYRSEDGNMCAIGCLIPDELYDPNMDKLLLGGYLFNVLENFPEIEQLFKYNDKLLLTDLQILHDDEENWDSSGFANVAKLNKIATRFNMNIAKLIECFPPCSEFKVNYDLRRQSDYV